MEFKLREWRMEDAESAARYANNPKIALNLRDAFPSPYSLQNAEFYIKSCLSADKNTNLSLAIDVNNEAVGSIGVFVKDDVYSKSAELGYWLGEPFWGMGIMSGAVCQITRTAFSRFDIARIFAEPFARNNGSRKVLENAGFRLEGILKNSVYKNGELGDSCVYALLRPERDEEFLSELGDAER
ncbi:MAG: GNAT family protein [Bacillota bacterium]|nr:GNAT family protein [Bacillota bacterium]